MTQAGTVAIIYPQKPVGHHDGYLKTGCQISVFDQQGGGLHTLYLHTT